MVCDGVKFGYGRFVRNTNRCQIVNHVKNGVRLSVYSNSYEVRFNSEREKVNRS